MAQTHDPLSPSTASGVLKKVVAAVTNSSGTQVDAGPRRRIERGRARHRRWKPRWAENMAFYEGRQFVYRATTGTSTVLNELETRGNAKPEYKARGTWNRVLGYVIGEVSAGTQRVPGYQVTPTTTDPEDIKAARLGEKVLVYLYTYLNLRAHVVDADLYAVVCGEGFVRPYWNPTLGDKLPSDPNNPDDVLYTGELCLEAYGPQEVYWEPGCRFEESPWHAIEKARTLDEVRSMPGFNGAEIVPDASGYGSFVQGQLDKTAADGDMVLVTEYLELPSSDNEDGRRLLIANNKLIAPEEPYPCHIKGPMGYEPVLCKLPFFPTPDRERDMSLVEHMLDPQRTFNDSMNKAVEWKNIAIWPQMVTGPAGLRDRRTNQPGAVLRSKSSAQDVKWQDVPAIPDSLFRMADQAVSTMEEIASQRTPPSNIDSGKSLQVWVERDNARRAFIVQALADFHSKLGRHLLYYVQRYYTEERLIAINGKAGDEYIDFKGADLRDQLAVRVLPGSIEPLTKEAVEQRIMNYAQLGWISPQRAIAAIEGDQGQALLESFDLQIERTQRMIQKAIALGDAQGPNATPEDFKRAGVPIAKEWENASVALETLKQYFLTADFENQAPVVQEVLELYANQFEQLRQNQALQDAQQQATAAQSLGMSNAAAPQTNGKPMPSLPAVRQ